MSVCSPTRNQGFTLLSMAIAVLLAGLLAVTANEAIEYLSRANTAANLANGLQQADAVAGAYATTYFSQLVNGQPVCAAGGSPCVAHPDQPTVADLRNLGLASNFQATAYTGGAWAFAMATVPAGCSGATCNVQWQAYLPTPPRTQGGYPDYGIVGDAAVRSGLNAGFSGPGNPSVVSGLKGVWTAPNPAGAVPGVLLAEGSFNSSQFSVYLPRSGVLPMTGDLNMGGHNVNNASSVNVAGASLDQDQGGSLELGGNNTTAGTGTPYIDFHLGGAGVQDFNARLIDSTDSTLSLQGANGAGSLAVQGRIGTNGLSPSAGYPGGWAGGVHAYDVYAEGTVGVGTGGSINSSINRNGDGFLSDNLTVGTPGGTGTLALAPNAGANPGSGCTAPGSLAASASGSGQTLVCQGGIWTAATLQLATLNTACGVQGGLGVAANGAGMLCAAGYWTPLQQRMGALALQQSTVATNGQFEPNPPCTAGGAPKFLLTPQSWAEDSTLTAWYHYTPVAGGIVVDITNASGAPTTDTALVTPYCQY